MFVQDSRFYPALGNFGKFMWRKKCENNISWLESAAAAGKCGFIAKLDCNWKTNEHKTHTHCLSSTLINKLFKQQPF
jgi:hypothetical protein